MLCLALYATTVSSADRACISGPTMKLPFCNSSLSFDARTRDLVMRLNLEEKIG